MKQNKWIYFLFILFCTSCRLENDLDAKFYECDFRFPDASSTHPDREKYQHLIDDMTRSGVPGIIMCIYKDKRIWCGASGMADIHNQIPMKPCNKIRVGSTVKTCTAVTILRLAQEKKLSLDDPIAMYLDESVIKNIENADRTTIRQCLQHSSGIYNYIQSLQFQTASLNDLIRVWQPNDLLKYARNRKAYFEPGQDVRYSNTNYILLGMVIDKVTGTRFYNVFQEKIFSPFSMYITSFAAKNPIPYGIVQGYADVYSNLNIINTTYYSGWDYYTADGGLISNPYDMMNFLKNVFDERIISSSFLQEMTTWKEPSEKDDAFFSIQYGLGIFKMETPYGDAYFHSGDAIGYYANMIYFPAQNVIITYATNGNYGKIDKLISSKEALMKIFDTVLN